MHRYETLVLNALTGKGSIGLEELSRKSGVGADELLWAVGNLEKQGFVKVEREARSDAVLTEEGREYANAGLPEQRLLSRLEERTLSVSSLKSETDRIALIWAKKKGCITMEDGRMLLTERGVKAIGEGSEEERILKRLAREPGSYTELQERHPQELKELVSRKLLEVRSRSQIIGIRITTEGSSAAKGAAVETGVIDALSKGIIANRSWAGKRFKKYDVTIPVERELAARRHPLSKLIGEISRAYISNGFREISGPAVESAFWDFDSLFVPQDHPARDAQDTFYLSNPGSIDLKDKEYVEKVSKAHEKAWHEAWSIETARQGVLRTHTTSTTSRYIYQIIDNIVSTKSRYLLPVKLFSIGRIFRNENIDYRHLADFYQHDGIVIGEGLTLANLFDTLIKLFESVGLQVKFRPSYFPFVEPGVEIYAHYAKGNEWVEMGGAGLIRKEITGVTRKNINVLAWGIGVERTLLLRDSSLSGIAELYNNDIGWIRKRSMV